MNTNIVTVRNLGGEQVVEINGREVPFVQSISYTDADTIDMQSGQSDKTFRVSLVFDTAQYNEVDHGHDIPQSTGNPRADEYLKLLGELYALVRDARWWQLPRVIKQVRIILAAQFGSAK